MGDIMLERRAQMWPSLTPAQIDRVAAFGERRPARAGEVLFDAGDRNRRFFVAVRGAIEVVRPVDGHEEPITILSPGQFTGEVDMLSARASLVRARMAEDGEVVALDRDH